MTDSLTYTRTSLAPCWGLHESSISASADRVRGEATSIAVLSLWAAYFVLVFTFPMLFERLKERSFYIYTVVCAVGGVDGGG